MNASHYAGVAVSATPSATVLPPAAPPLLIERSVSQYGALLRITAIQTSYSHSRKELTD